MLYFAAQCERAVHELKAKNFIGKFYTGPSHLSSKSLQGILRKQLKYMENDSIFNKIVHHCGQLTQEGYQTECSYLQYFYTFIVTDNAALYTDCHVCTILE